MKFTHSVSITKLALICLIMSQMSSKSTKTTNKISLDASGDSYDRYLLATSWQGTTCKFHHCTHFGSPSIFNLHGLWPSTAGNSPEECTSIDFTEEDLDENLKRNLYNYWNSGYHGNWEFINHEITKHGSCWDPSLGDKSLIDSQIVSTINQYNPEDPHSLINTFLEVVLVVSKELNPYDVLAQKGIVPSDSETYQIDDVLDAVNSHNGTSLGVIPVCLKDKESGDMYLGELRLCLDLNYKPRECEPGVTYSHIKKCRSSVLRYPLFPE